MFAIMDKSFKEHGDNNYTIKQIMKENPNLRFVAAPLGSRVVLELYDIDLIKEFMARQTKFVIKDTEAMGALPELVLEGLAFVEGKKWKKQRKVLSRVFHFDYMNQCIPSINFLVKKWIENHCEAQNSKLCRELEEGVGGICEKQSLDD